jgi:GNAT superfamily N-acetyltransferase
MAADRTTPGDGPATDIGVVVADSWQGQGVGSALVRALISQAQARGVTSLTMDVLPSNQRVLAMIADHWAAAGTDRSADYVTVQVPLPRTQAAESELTPAAPEPAAHWRNDQAIAAAGPAAIA